MLWFDVEEGYNTTTSGTLIAPTRLWFDVEEGYNTTAVQQAHFKGFVVISLP